MKKTVTILLVLVLNLGLIDAYYFLNENKPLFTFRTNNFKDGGTSFHYGVGYQLIEWNVLNVPTEKREPFYYKKREVRIFPFFRDIEDFEKMDKSTFKVER